MSMPLDRRQMLAGTALAAGLAGTGAFASQSTQTGPDLSGKSILITGTSSGFGRLGAEHYARLGAKVFATMRNIPRPEAEELRQLASDEGYDLHVIEIDVTDDAQVDAGVKKALGMNEGRLDVLVNNAGISNAGAIEMQDMEQTTLLFDTNVYGPHRMARAVLPAMRAQGSGQIFQVSSQLGRVIAPAYGQYSPTKFALEAMSEQMAYELVPHGIEVTIIEPGGYPTKIWENASRQTERLLARTPEELQAPYADLLTVVQASGARERPTDPMDVPRAIAEIIAMPAGERPLRRPVHPAFIPQEAINKVSAETQVRFLGDSPLGPLVRAVHNV
ncbi:SDR family oxidoreductase [Parvularcula lutaonensis]|uniref:SDR family oxidoreductase n=1 Tax=Parvularcula lutaonensis TaxID=491923 RepID=A0ABV7MBY5_9PROT|nr:SDR family oxidoreductase [Parvularcula lutaonensis]GGY36359.1 short-chain dehydrogenase/reductase [Parvularcula lutaonensis]